MLFKPSYSEQRLPPSYYRGCWHEVSRGFLWVRSTHRRIVADCFHNPDSGLHPEGIHPTRGVAPSDLRPLRKIRYCSPPWGSGQCLSPNVPDQPLSPGIRRSLGKPLPYQQADTPQAAPKAKNLYSVPRYRSALRECRKSKVESSVHFTTFHFPPSTFCRKC